jgi:hypothetical protein
MYTEMFRDSQSTYVSTPPPIPVFFALQNLQIFFASCYFFVECTQDVYDIVCLLRGRVCLSQSKNSKETTNSCCPCYRLHYPIIILPYLFVFLQSFWQRL